MSNNAVGNVFAAVIERVAQESQNDFEESGIDQLTLNEMQETWQKRLSELHVAQFPWDPPPPQLANPPTLPSNVTKVEEDSPVPSTAPPPPTSSSSGYGGVRIKTEPGYEAEGSGYSPLNGYATSNMNPQVAHQRAANLLQQQYGSQANASIGALQQQAGLSFPSQQKKTGLQLPGQGQAQQSQPESEKARRNSLQDAQTDGADAFDEDTREGAAGPSSRQRYLPQYYDNLIRQHIEEMAQRLDSGLLIPTEEQGLPKRKGRKSFKGKRISRAVQAPSGSKSAQSGDVPDVPSLDGELEDDKTGITDDERDEDAINSDLDDSEDELVKGEDEDDEFGETILCLYDKVQRVKNKWKCTLKDGLLTTNGKEYVFHKAQGEFEW